MTKSYRKEALIEAYRPAFEELQLIVGELGDFQQKPSEHGEVERHLQRRGLEIMRQVFQCYLNLASAGEDKRAEVIGEDGQLRRYGRVRRRELMSVFGAVEVCRLGYSDRGVGSVFPLDAQLNLPRQRYTDGLREQVSEAVASGSYEAAVQRIDRRTAGHLPKRQAEQVAQGIAADFEAFYRERETPVRPLGEGNEILVLSSDGKGIVMRREDLREQTRRRAEGHSHKLGSRLSRGEKKNRKRIATVATVYEVGAHVRGAEQIMMPQEKAERAPAPRPVQKRVWASVQRSVAAVLDEAFTEAKRRDPEAQREWVMLVDGHEGQLREVDAAITRHEAQVTVIQDFVHVLEYLWKAAWCLFEEGDRRAEQWVQERAIAILRGRCSEVAAGMRRSATWRNLSQTERAPLDICARYLLKNRERLDYAPALQRGLPIATGVVEGACRHLVKQRMECSGARWSLNGAEAVLQLRALRMSGDWDEYLAFHNHAERRRNYSGACAELRKAA